MKILTVSDVVVNRLYSASVKERFASVDLVLSCGDLPAYYLEFLVSMLDTPLYYVVGNHAGEHHAPAQDRQDWGQRPRLVEEPIAGDNKLSGPYGCTNLDGKVVNYKGLLIAGLQGCKWYNGGPYQYSEDQMGRKILLLQPQLMLNRVRHGRALDILITHAPPAGIHDDVDVAHHGFHAFLKFMDDFAPRYLIHGHKHVYMHGETTVTQYNRTTVINTYGFRSLELEVEKT
jgi:hypothetical protein